MRHILLFLYRWDLLSCGIGIKLHELFCWNLPSLDRVFVML